MKLWLNKYSIIGDKMDDNASSSSNELSSPRSVRSIPSSFEKQRKPSAKPKPPLPPRGPDRPRSQQRPPLPDRFPKSSSLSTRKGEPCSNSSENTGRPYTQQSSSGGLSPDASNYPRKAPPPARPPKSPELQKLLPALTPVNVTPPMKGKSPLEPVEMADPNFPSKDKKSLTRSTVDVKKIGVRMWGKARVTKVFQDTVDDVRTYTQTSAEMMAYAATARIFLY